MLLCTTKGADWKKLPLVCIAPQKFLHRTLVSTEVESQGLLPVQPLRVVLYCLKCFQNLYGESFWRCSGRKNKILPSLMAPLWILQIKVFLHIVGQRQCFLKWDRKENLPPHLTLFSNCRTYGVLLFSCLHWQPPRSAAPSSLVKIQGIPCYHQVAGSQQLLWRGLMWFLIYCSPWALKVSALRPQHLSADSRVLEFNGCREYFCAILELYGKAICHSDLQHSGETRRLLLSLVWGRWKSAVLCINFLMLLFSRLLALGAFHQKEAGMEQAA